MAVHGAKPFIHVSDSNGNPIVGATLKVYEAGTTNYRAIYSDAGLSIALTNPLASANASDASGNFPRFYMASGTYKLRAETSVGTLIWEVDNIDTALSAGAGALPVASGGTGATTAAGARTNLDVPSNSEMTALASSISALTASIQAIVGQPQGRLTLTSGTPILSSGVTAGTSVYYTPYTGAQIPLYDSTIFNVRSFSELTLALNASHTANLIYDVFIWDESGTLTIGTGPAWTTATAGSGARGSGAGTTELTRITGILVNANAMTTRNGATTYSVTANKATYVGSIYIDGTNGQLTCHTAFGQSRKWGVWNAYNRKRILLRCGDATANWAAPNTSLRQSNGSTANTLAIFTGLAEEPFDLSFIQEVKAAVNNTVNTGTISIGVNSVAASSGLTGNVRLSVSTGGAADVVGMAVAKYLMPPALGLNNINALEQTAGTAANTTYFGTEGVMLLSADWWG